MPEDIPFWQKLLGGSATTILLVFAYKFLPDLLRYAFVPKDKKLDFHERFVDNLMKTVVEANERIDNLRQRYDLRIETLQKEHDAKMDIIRAEYESEIDALKLRLEQCKDDCLKLKNDSELLRRFLPGGKSS